MKVAYKGRYGIGDPSEMHCARLSATLVQRDTWIRKYGLKMLIHDYDNMMRILKQRGPEGGDK